MVQRSGFKAVLLKAAISVFCPSLNRNVRVYGLMPKSLMTTSKKITISPLENR